MDRTQHQISTRLIQFQIILRVEVEDRSEILVIAQVDLIMMVLALVMDLQREEEPMQGVVSILLVASVKTVGNKSSWTLIALVMVRFRTLSELPHTN